MQINVNGLTKKFRKFAAVDNVNFEISSGLHGLLGPNGAGKTTLMKMVVGMLEPTCGTVLCDGTDINGLGAAYCAKLGFLPQQLNMYDDFSGKKMLQYIADLKGMDKVYAKQRIPYCIEAVGMTGDEDKKIKSMSGGMKRRIGIAQAILNDPDFLVLDEPTAGLDPSERIRLRNYLLDIAKDKTVILSTHIVSDLEYAADDIIMLQRGRIIDFDTPDRMIDKLKNVFYIAFCEDDELDGLYREYNVIGHQRVNEQNEVRIISDVPVEFGKHKTPRCRITIDVLHREIKNNSE